LVLSLSKFGPKLAAEFMRGSSLKASLEARSDWLQGTALAKVVVGIDLGRWFAHS
jgi:hypothetical protein